MGVLVAVVNTKGGSGKTTTATNLASWLALKSVAGKTKLIDADAHQHSADDWAETRLEANDPLPVVGRAILRGSIYTTLIAERDVWHNVIVDCPGSDSPETRGAMGAADVIVMPVGMGQSDIGALGQMGMMIRQMREGGSKTPVIAVLNRIDLKCTREAAEALAVLSTMGDYFSVHPKVLWDRQAVRTAMRSGLGVHELPRSSHDEKATAEFTSLFTEVFNAIS